MSAAIRSEVRKLRSSRSSMLLLTAGLVYAILNGVATAQLAGLDASAPLGSASNLANIVRGGGVGPWVMLLVAILGVTSEYRHDTIVITSLMTPRRGIVAAAKTAVFATVGLIYALVGIAGGLAAATPTLISRHARLESADLPLSAAAGVVVVSVLYAVAGVGIGALCRRQQTLAAVGAIVWLGLAENIVGPIAGWGFARWLPGRAAAAAAGAGGGHLLSMPAGAGVFTAYVVVAGGIAALVTLRRDVG